MQMQFVGQLVNVRQAKDKGGKVKDGLYKIKFLTMPDGGDLEVSSSVVPDEKYKFQQFQWTLDVTARMFQGLLSVTANSVHGGAVK